MKIHHWTVRYAMPVAFASGHEYTHNFNEHILAPTIEAAIAKIRAEYPRAEVWGVSHHGEIKHIVES